MAVGIKNIVFWNETTSTNVSDKPFASMEAGAPTKQQCHSTQLQGVIFQVAVGFIQKYKISIQCVARGRE
jgi:hypothetical protein